MADYDENAFVRAGTLDLMLRRFASLVTDPTGVHPHKDAETGRYDNLGRWVDSRRDGFVYGVMTPVYSYSPETGGVKTGANAGLVLEASTETYAGRNDYEGKALFLCPRVNGGVDADGTNYVTAIEGYDADFDPTADTYVLTSVYYKRVTNDGEHALKEICDTPREGFVPCKGAYKPDGTLRPYILRAVYGDSGAMSSRSGTQPAGSAGYPTNVGHCANYDLAQSKSRIDGLSYYSYGDWVWLIDMMQVMLGVKAPKSVVTGCCDYNYTYTVAGAEDDARRVLLTDEQASRIVVGSTVSVGASGRANNDVIKCAKVVSKELLEGGVTAVNLDLPAGVNVLATHKLVTMPWKNGTCDNVLGTFGARTTEALTNSIEPFKFQNVEWGHGIWTCVTDMCSVVSVDGTTMTHNWYVVDDVDDVAAVGGEGWDELETSFSAQASYSNYTHIKDNAEEAGAIVPSVVGGTSTTGMMVGWYPGSRTAQTREMLVGGALGNGVCAGVGAVYSYNVPSHASWAFGGRSSAIGHSGAPAAEEG